MTAREALRAAITWLDEHPKVDTSSVYVDAAPAPDGSTDGWHALLHVDDETLRGAGGPIVRERFAEAALTCWSAQVAPGVYMVHVELDVDRRVPPTLPPEPTPFAEAFDAAFDRLRGHRGLNLVALSDLRAALGGVSHEAFDIELYALRVANRYVLHTHDGRSGPATPEQLDAAIVEDGRTFVYVARREST